MPTSKHRTSLRQQLAVCTMNAGLQPAIKLNKKLKAECNHPTVIPDRHVIILRCTATGHMSSLLFCLLLMRRKWAAQRRKWDKQVKHIWQPYTCHLNSLQLTSSTVAMAIHHAQIWSQCGWWDRIKNSMCKHTSKMWSSLDIWMTYPDADRISIPGVNRVWVYKPNSPQPCILIQYCSPLYNCVMGSRWYPNTSAMISSTTGSWFSLANTASF